MVKSHTSAPARELPGCPGRRVRPGAPLDFQFFPQPTVYDGTSLGHDDPSEEATPEIVFRPCRSFYTALISLAQTASSILPESSDGACRSLSSSEGRSHGVPG